MTGEAWRNVAEPASGWWQPERTQRQRLTDTGRGLDDSPQRREGGTMTPIGLPTPKYDCNQAEVDNYITYLRNNARDRKEREVVGRIITIAILTLVVITAAMIVAVKMGVLHAR